MPKRTFADFLTHLASSSTESKALDYKDGTLTVYNFESSTFSAAYSRFFNRRSISIPSARRTANNYGFKKDGSNIKLDVPGATDLLDAISKIDATKNIGVKRSSAAGLAAPRLFTQIRPASTKRARASGQAAASSTPSDTARLQAENERLRAENASLQHKLTLLQAELDAVDDLPPLPSPPASLYDWNSSELDLPSSTTPSSVLDPAALDRLFSSCLNKTESDQAADADPGVGAPPHRPI